MFSPQTTACTGPSNSALASLMTSSRDVHGGMWVNNNSPPRPAFAIRPASVPDRCRCGGRSGHGSRTPRTGTRRRRWPVRPANRTPGVPAVDQRRAAGIGDPQTVGLGGVGDQSGSTVSAPNRTASPSLQCRMSKMSEKSSSSPPTGEDAPPAATRCRWARTGSPGPWRASGDTAATRTAPADPDNGRRAGATAGCAPRWDRRSAAERRGHRPEIEHQRRGVGCGQQVSGRRRIRPDNAAGATEDGDSHSHQLAMPATLRGKHHQFAREILGRSLLALGGARPAAHR